MASENERSVDDIAVQWFVTLRDDDVTDAQRKAFADWRMSDPAHAKAWAEVEQMWGGLDALAPNYAAERAASSPIERIATLRPPAFRTRPAKPGQRGFGRLVAAAVVMLVAGLGWLAMPVGLFADYRTSIGERRVIALDDGSEVELGSESALDIGFNGARRKVTLVAGEAFFNVAKDAARPFVVEAGGGQVTVLGTAFNVKIASGVAVSVTHNSVEVSVAQRTPVRVRQGQGVRYDSKDLSDAVPVDLDAVQAWRQDQLIFHDARLEDVLAELQRYRRGYIQLLGGDVGGRRVTAVFDTRRPDAALETIARSLDLRIFRATSFLIGIAPN